VEDYVFIVAVGACKAWHPIAGSLGGCRCYGYLQVYLFKWCHQLIANYRLYSSGHKQWSECCSTTYNLFAGGYSHARKNVNLLITTYKFDHRCKERRPFVSLPRSRYGHAKTVVKCSPKTHHVHPLYSRLPPPKTQRNPTQNQKDLEFTSRLSNPV